MDWNAGMSDAETVRPFFWGKIFIYMKLGTFFPSLAMQRQVGFWCGWNWWSDELHQLFSKLGRLFVIIDQSFVKRSYFTDNAMGDWKKARGCRENVLFHHIGRWPHASMGFGGYAMSKLDINISVKPRIVDYIHF